ncbi:MAG: DUF1573 domain-containing protein [Methylacidiphilales bacterium]|nr:DUF1573 domain-containing protein [Candidatus Methylacidiphilales bacterium]MDW8350072.1 DUF1573 domain-containing protein [Verrucomicrobiae bacterium]
MKTIRNISIAMVAIVASHARLHAELFWPVKEIDFKAKPEHIRTVARFPFINDGKETITITSIQSSCGCTAALPNGNKRDYAPGEKGEIEVVFDHGDRIGQQTKTVTITTSDKPNEPTILTLRVEIPVILKIEPNFIFWTPQDTVSPKISRISVGVNEPVRILQVHSDNENFSAELKTIEEGKNYEVHVSARKTDADIFGSIWIQTDYPRTNPRTFRISARVIPPPSPPTASTATSQ